MTSYAFLRGAVHDVLQHVLHMSELDIQRIGEVVVHRDGHVLGRTSVHGQAPYVGTGVGGGKDRDHSSAVVDLRGARSRNVRSAERAPQKPVSALPDPLHPAPHLTSATRT